jgi:hypothetical protein
MATKKARTRLLPDPANQRKPYSAATFKPEPKKLNESPRNALNFAKTKGSVDHHPLSLFLPGSRL